MIERELTRNAQLCAEKRRAESRRAGGGGLGRGKVLRHDDDEIKVVLTGALDGLSMSEMPFADKDTCDFPLVTKLGDGSVVWLNEPDLVPHLLRAADRIVGDAVANGDHCASIMLMCAGTFAKLVPSPTSIVSKHDVPILKPFELSIERLHRAMSPGSNSVHSCDATSFTRRRRLLVACPPTQQLPITARWEHAGFEVVGYCP
jgi:hypothetical protein